jgi:hypothetical protein
LLLAIPRLTDEPRCLFQLKHMRPESWSEESSFGGGLQTDLDSCEIHPERDE